MEDDGDCDVYEYPLPLGGPYSLIYLVRIRVTMCRVGLQRDMPKLNSNKIFYIRSELVTLSIPISPAFRDLAVSCTPR